jgi:hypothetical protein
MACQIVSILSNLIVALFAILYEYERKVMTLANSLGIRTMHNIVHHCASAMHNKNVLVSCVT